MLTMKPVLTYYDIAKGVTAFSTTRHGGFSKGTYGEFNINPYCGDDKEAVAANMRALELELGIIGDNLLMSHQVHGINNLAVTGDVLYCPHEMRPSLFEGVDSLTTNRENVCVGVSTADCIPVLLYDSRHRVVAAVHAGWRGTAQSIVLATIHAMWQNYYTRPEDVVAVIGPGISLKNFEVGQEVYDQFANLHFDMSHIAKWFPCDNSEEKDGMEGKWHIDLPLCNRMQLESVGVHSDNIIVSGICTYDNATDYFSARRLGLASGRIYTGIILK